MEFFDKEGYYLAIKGEAIYFKIIIRKKVGEKNV